MFKLKFICKSVRNKLLFITGMGTSLVMAAIIWGMYTGWTNFNHLQHVIDEDLALKSRVQHAFAEFSSEVHSWKNVLLRGYNPDNLDKYCSQVESKHKRVQ